MKPPSPDIIIEHGQLGDAHFSPCRRYRYLLTRGEPRAERMVAFVMLNPSTADADRNDPTITRCIRFAARFATARGWPEHRVSIVNLFAIRATDPRDCFAASRPEGDPENGDYIYRVCMVDADLTILAWGAHPKAAARVRHVEDILCSGSRLQYQLGASTKNGSPRHPLYLRDDTELEIRP